MIRVKISARISAGIRETRLLSPCIGACCSISAAGLSRNLAEHALSPRRRPQDVRVVPEGSSGDRRHRCVDPEQVPPPAAASSTSRFQSSLSSPV